LAAGTDRFDPDSDDDGANDGEEVLAGTEPTDEESYWRLRVYRTPGGDELDWDSQTGRRYTLYTVENLGGQNWSQLPGCVNVPGIDGIMSFTNAPSQKAMFYRVGLQPDS
jgi:hypothetical protein